MRRYLDTLGALRVVAEGRKVPPNKYGALQRASLIRVRGCGGDRHPVLTEAGRKALADDEGGR